ncbi:MULTISPECIES: sensor histidine kinase [Halomonadaceae]|uniref:sensor histidine kinase n=1 Tax=Halomonadaceae TaxID=28256 RepID=UPI0012F02F6E|nr:MULTISPECIES: sensor histidine kinase [Halomonas]CAD5263663.1 GHKL domain-containing protein [Halomonas sp. 113]CAD5265711.1 GHKL domain-containing protein [Halomonas sp. 59]CAD5278466.1 GHKL domain-containing protein [Halomonas sp. I3]CAD5284497.1 GHKL domain-containing protein [Halomonas sp. 156]VXB55370.1 GHKL domain-containing protein [Halomonas titanicae]
MQKTSSKDLIALELQKESPDWRLVESLSRVEVSQDPTNVRFSVDAGHIQRLGVELVGKKDTALSELIKNAFDADATEVNLHFQDSNITGGTLTISDNGSGMTMDVIRNSWMRISTVAKAEYPLSPFYERRRAGRKGIGRFAVQRLAKSLELRTSPSGEPYGHSVFFDWDEEFTAGKDLNDIFNQVQTFEKELNESGTELRMICLRDSWTPAAISRVWRAVLLLQPPFKIAKVSGNKIGKQADPGFTVRVNGETNDKSDDSFSIEKDFLSQALASIEASIEEDGKAKVRVISKKLDLDDFVDFEDTYVLVGPVSLTSRYFIYSSETLSGMRMQEAAAMGRRYGGIRVYRNGFRVLPYGDPHDDWLGMDSFASRRKFLAPGNNQNFFGQVSILSEENPLLEETASREGLQENEAFEELQDFAKKALLWAINRIAAARNRKQTASQPRFVSQVRPPSQSIRTAIELLEDEGASDDDKSGQGETESDAHNSLPKNEQLLGALKAAEEDAKASEEEYERQREASLQYEAMLRLLASLGLSISVFGHEVKGAQEAIRARLQLMSDEIEALPIDEYQESLQKQHEMLETSTRRLFDIGGYIAGLMSQTESRDLRELSVTGSLKRFGKQFESYMSKQQVIFDPVDVAPSSLRTIEMHASELDSVLLNFLTNSIKSMKKAKVSQRRIRMDAKREGKYVVIGFEDNGIGIPKEQHELIFDAFYTTTLIAEDDGLAGPGTGLGLKIVSDIAKSYGGDVSVAEPSKGFNCRIEFKILANEVTQ